MRGTSYSLRPGHHVGRGGRDPALQADRTSNSPSTRLAQAHPTPHARSGAPTLLHRRVGVGEEAEVPLVVPADQRHVALRLDAVLAPGGGRGRVGQHGQGQAGAVAFPGAQQAAAVNPWWGQGHKTAWMSSEALEAPLATEMLRGRRGLPV